MLCIVFVLMYIFSVLRMVLVVKRLSSVGVVLCCARYECVYLFVGGCLIVVLDDFHTVHSPATHTQIDFKINLKNTK